jgi:hypothetical protein
MTPHLARPARPARPTAHEAALGALIACATACGSFTAPAPDPLPPAVRIDAVTPAEGPVGGGTEVVLSGRGFDGTVRVRFDDATALVDVTSSNTLRVAVPPAPGGRAASVDVTVVSDRGEATLADGFTYVNADTEGRDTAGTSPAAGKVVGYVELGHLQTACPECFGRSSSLDIQATAIFHAPTDVDWNDWLPANGTCGANHDPYDLTVQVQDLGATLVLQSGVNAIALTRGSSPAYDPTYLSGQLTDAQIVRNASWDLVIPGPGDWGTTTLPGALVTGTLITAIAPDGLLLTGNGLFTQPLDRAGQVFSWSPLGADRAVVRLTAADGTNRTITCVGADAGSLLVPGGALSTWQRGTPVIVDVYRWREAEAVRDDGGRVQTVSWFGIEGTGVLR